MTNAYIIEIENQAVALSAKLEEFAVTAKADKARDRSEEVIGTIDFDKKEINLTSAHYPENIVSLRELRSKLGDLIGALEVAIQMTY